MRFAVALSLVAACLGCSGASVEAPETRSRRPTPGEEPLETASIGDDEVVPLAPESGTGPSPSGRPCAWARAWADPSAPKPLLAGVGGVPNPVKRVDEAIRLPAREQVPSGEMIVEFIVGPDGGVLEASVVRSSDPPWPEAEQSILKTIQHWQYDPPAFEGTAVTVCTTVIVNP